MCVILVARDTRPTEDMVRSAWKKNDDGGGVAWRELVKVRRDGKSVEEVQVRWVKGIENVEEMVAYAETLPMPFIMHYRIASCGGIRPELTHPFPIDENVPEILNGQTGGYVLFHNGHWSKWGDYSMDMTIHLHTKVPKGAWSDSRAMAWAAGHYGNEVLNFIGEKCVIFSPTDLEVFRKDWDVVEGVLCSNKFFIDPPVYNGYMGGQHYQQTMCKFASCTRKDINALGWCSTHNPKKVETLVFPDDNDDTLPVVSGTVVDGETTALVPSGGTGAVDPFAVLDRLLREKRLSKNRYKKLRKQLTVRLLNQMVPPVLVKH